MSHDSRATRKVLSYRQQAAFAATVFPEYSHEAISVALRWLASWGPKACCGAAYSLLGRSLLLPSRSCGVRVWSFFDVFDISALHERQRGTVFALQNFLPAMSTKAAALTS
jgi:hypothetical protein